VKIGLQIPRFAWSGGAAQIAQKLAVIAQTAEGAGFASLWVMDHLLQLDPILGSVDDPMLEGYSTLTFLAAHTRHVRLGTLVTAVTSRYPGFLIKQVTNLDVLSGGRAYFGVGAGWYSREAAGLGFIFPPIKERFEWLEETLQIAHHMWSGNREPFEGKHFQLAEPICSPMPLSEPHPPILIGGSGETKTLRFVALYANACNLFARAGEDELKHKLGILQKHCADMGRPYDAIEKTALDSVHIAPGMQTAEEVISRCQELAEIGFQHIIFNMPNVQDIYPLEVFGDEIIPAIKDIWPP